MISVHTLIWISGLSNIGKKVYEDTPYYGRNQTGQISWSLKFESWRLVMIILSNKSTNTINQNDLNSNEQKNTGLLGT